MNLTRELEQTRHVPIDVVVGNGGHCHSDGGWNRILNVLNRDDE